MVVNVESADVCLLVESSNTAIIQEYHLTIEHSLCEEIENKLMGEF